MAIKQEMAAPHIRRKRTTSAIMADVVIALLPVCAWAVWLFRWQAAAVLATTTAVCSLADWVCLKLRGRGGFDGSAAVTGLLLGLSLPAGTALWAAALSGVFAVAVVKQLPGGIGRNLFNPAMAGRALLLVALPQTLGGRQTPKRAWQNKYAADKQGPMLRLYAGRRRPRPANKQGQKILLRRRGRCCT